MSRKALIVAALVFALACATSAGIATAAVQGQVPSFPLIYGGKVYVNDQPAPDGIEIYAKFNDTRTGKVFSQGGNFSGLGVSIPIGATSGKITFWATRGFGEVQAAESVQYNTSMSSTFSETTPLDLHFPTVPGNFQTPAALTPTPTAALPIPGEPLVPALFGIALAAGAVLLVGGGVALRAARTHRA